ncbi:MAG: ubiquinol-cytochrome c reductase iron-sulfur subunit [Chloroflexota bacterium]|nr:MAG: (2Fe-2S)-binding protein [Chloroflexota bacterium]
MNLIRRAVSREGFIVMFMGLVGAVGGLLVGIPIIGSILGPLVNSPKSVWRDVGAIDKFTIGKTVQVKFAYSPDDPSQWGGATNYTGAWLRRNGKDSFTAFAVYCTHLGCPVDWFQTPQLFLCPCHGSVFNGDGTVAGGPAPRPLFKYETRVNGGRVQIKTQKIPVVNPLGGVGFGE